MCVLSVNFHLGLGEERKGRVGRGRDCYCRNFVLKCKELEG